MHRIPIRSGGFFLLVGAAPIPVYRRLARRIAIDNFLFLLSINRFFGVFDPRR
jgi:hypothetical protein